MSILKTELSKKSWHYKVNTLFRGYCGRYKIDNYSTTCNYFWRTVGNLIMYAFALIIIFCIVCSIIVYTMQNPDKVISEVFFWGWLFGSVALSIVALKYYRKKFPPKPIDTTKLRRSDKMDVLSNIVDAVFCQLDFWLDCFMAWKNKHCHKLTFKD